MAAADAEIIDVPKEKHRFQPGQDPLYAMCDDVYGEICGLGLTLGEESAILGHFLVKGTLF